MLGEVGAGGNTVNKDICWVLAIMATVISFSVLLGLMFNAESRYEAAVRDGCVARHAIAVVTVGGHYACVAEAK